MKVRFEARSLYIMINKITEIFNIPADLSAGSTPKFPSTPELRHLTFIRSKKLLLLKDIFCNVFFC